MATYTWEFGKSTRADNPLIPHCRRTKLSLLCFEGHGMQRVTDDEGGIYTLACGHTRQASRDPKKPVASVDGFRRDKLWFDGTR